MGQGGRLAIRDLNFRSMRRASPNAANCTMQPDYSYCILPDQNYKRSIYTFLNPENEANYLLILR